MKLNIYYYFVDKLTIATTKVGGKNFRATAKCAPGDKYDPNVGAEIAAARLKYKVMCAMVKESHDNLVKANKALEKVAKYAKNKADKYAKKSVACAKAFNEMVLVEQKY